MLDRFFDRCGRLLHEGTPFVSVTLIKTEGSTPQDPGSKMIVTPDGLDMGTIGGGRLEAKAIAHALEMLQKTTLHDVVLWNLKSDVGMTCGGRVELFFETTGATCWPITIFGAGHVSQALCRLLDTFPCQVTCIDPRTEWLDRLPAKTRCVCLETPAEAVSSLDDQTFVLCMTKGHSSDVPVLREIQKQRRRFPFLGVIGSRAKRATLIRELQGDRGETPELAFHCPIGLPIGSNHPGEIAVSIAAQLLETRDAIAKRDMETN